ncbi:Quad-[4Fe-4S] ferredoxin, HycB/HydN/HyfA family [hydrothermal vent metagenome]|uniref:Quad-[4Fe-4S] ferredoxin, HycB/HydN/HyfA family n=1 Tax=hydrothermal vent metagenome TaxID=652676 RepID=A0A3B0TZR6_9ZZZZ
MELNKKNKKTRRDFLKLSSAIAGSVAFYSMLRPIESVANGKTEVAKREHWYGFGFDIEKCIGCGACAKACKIENDVPREPFFFRTWVEQYTIKNGGIVEDENVIVESPNGGIDGFTQSVPDEDIFKSFFVPKTCNHCYKAPCVQVCPVGATFETPDGVVLVDSSYCVGCGYCIQACPYGARYLHPEKKTADKCTLCYHRLKKGLAPACVDVCPTGARMHGDLDDKEGPLVQFIKNNTCRVLKPYLNTKPKLFYNSLNEEVR